MTNDRPIVVQSEHLSPRPAAWLAERAQLIVCSYDDPAFAAHLANAEGLVVRTYTQVTDKLLAQAPRLKVVGRAGVALENIDIPACRARGVEVVHAPGSNAQAVVEYVLCLMGDALRPRVTVDRPVPQDVWDRLREEVFAKRQISERTVGILGLGRIGKRIAQVCGAIGCECLYHDVVDVPEEKRFGASPVSPEELFARSDVISIHIDSRPSNRHFVNAERIALMKSDVLVINTSRGFVFDYQALALFMRENRDAQAMIDVHDPEPFDASYPILGLKNVKLYPHLAGRTETALENMSWVVRDVMAVIEGRAPEHPAP